MNEFSIINDYFKALTPLREEVIIGSGDDAACLRVPEGYDVVVTTDTLVADVHFLSTWPAEDIAYKAVMVNVSDVAAMGATPCWASIALTLPEVDLPWIQGFAQGLKKSLQPFDICLIGGDLTKGPLSITITMHGLVPRGQAVRRSTAGAGDLIYVSGELGSAALAVQSLDKNDLPKALKSVLKNALHYPKARVDYAATLRDFASAAIDISDGLSADLEHICKASGLGACIELNQLPVNEQVKAYCGEKAALDFALTGGDDYQLCFTIPIAAQKDFESRLAYNQLQGYCIGVMQEEKGLRIKQADDVIMDYNPKGYSHF